MSRIEKLINALCSDGVEYVRIGDVVNYEQPTKYIVKSTDYNDNFNIPVLTAGQTFILGYTDETDGIYQATKENPVIIFDDFTGAFKWVDFSFKVKSSAMKMLKSDKKKALIRYIFHVMGYLNYFSDQHKRLWIGIYSDFKIPLPPLEIQREIVNILDNFAELIQNLIQELKLRKKQYAYYRDKLLTFGDDVECKLLGQIGKVSMCRRIMKNQTNSKNGIPFFKIGTFGKKADAYISFELFNEYKQKYSYSKKSDVLISASGTIGRTVIFDGKPAYFQDSNIVWIDNDETIVLNKYLYYFYQTNPWKISEGGTIARLYNDNLAKIKIPVPSVEEQKRIVSILDIFSKYCVLRKKELKLREKQYEYYRDKILTFKEADYENRR